MTDSERFVQEQQITEELRQLIHSLQRHARGNYVILDIATTMEEALNQLDDKLASMAPPF